MTVEIRNKAARYCSVAERCRQEVEQKLDAWGADEADYEDVIRYLYDNGYLDDSRYCRAFVHDKVAFAQWGRQKIRYALRAKRLPDGLIERALEETDTEVYKKNMEKLIASRPKATNEADKAKLVRFMLQRGYTYEEIANL
ncbi:MAG: RecX family transcriptional regulator [Paludibacteraceae bacterium]|nr:RecX family transcriptional regulator [Paludibacteraceae bacterium]